MTKKTTKKTTATKTSSQAPLVRKPKWGVLAAGESVTLTIDPPMTLAEQPTLFTNDVANLRIQDPHADRVTAVNHSDQPLPYVLIVVPKMLVKAAGLPWSQILDNLKQRFRRK